MNNKLILSEALARIKDQMSKPLLTEEDKNKEVVCSFTLYGIPATILQEWGYVCDEAGTYYNPQKGKSK